MPGYQDPETGKFISREEAERRGLVDPRVEGDTNTARDQAKNRKWPPKRRRVAGRIVRR